MKQKLFLIYFFLTCLFSSWGFACNHPDCTENKEYISLEQLRLEKEGIFVLFDHGLEQIALIDHDSNGLYCVKMTWQCTHCGEVNKWYRSKCKKCSP